jgi:hypothetical protein
MKTWALGLAALVGCVISLPAAFGETVTVTSNGEAVGVGGLSISVNNVGSTNWAGLFKWTVSGNGDVGGNTVGPVGTQFYTVCIQMGQYFYSGSTFNYDVVSINNGNPLGGVDGGYIDTVAAGQLQLLTDRYARLLVLSGTEKINNTTYTAGEVAAAYQLAVWEIEYDGGSGKNSTSASVPESFPGANYFTTGNMRASAAAGTAGADAIALSSYFLDNFALNTAGVDTTYSSWALVNGNYQDQFLGVPNIVPQTIQSVPLPSALPTGFALLVGLGIARKVKQRRCG